MSFVCVCRCSLHKPRTHDPRTAVTSHPHSVVWGGSAPLTTTSQETGATTHRAAQHGTIHGKHALTKSHIPRTLRKGEGMLSGARARRREHSRGVHTRMHEARPSRGASACGAGSPNPRRIACMLRPPRLPQQEPLPETSRRWRRRRSALRLRRRRDVVDRGRCLAIERLGGEAALAGRGRRGGHRRVAHRERDHHGSPEPNVEEHRIQHASQSTSTLPSVVCSTP